MERIDQASHEISSPWLAQTVRSLWKTREDVVMSRIDYEEMYEEMSRAECIRLLGTVPVGRVAVVVDGDPVIVPVNFVMNGEDIVFRTAVGTKFRGLHANPSVAFQVDHIDLVRET